MTSTTVYDNIKKSPQDQLNYRGLELPNKLRVLLIQDKNAQKGYAALNVMVGAMEDPKEFQGLAHFCEHMLFMGSAKYPGIDEYSDAVAQSGGGDNAYTCAHATNYQFESGAKEFYDILDRFSQFFISPQFTETATEKEMNAVNSEAMQGLNRDSSRNFHLGRMLSNEDSQIHKYQTGDLKTLNKPGIQQALLDFHTKYYSSDIMALAIVLNDSLDTMQTNVEKMFSEVPNKNMNPITYANQPAPYSPEKLGKLVKVVPVNDKDILQIKYLLPPLFKHRNNKPGNYIQHLFGHECKGSILTFLIEEGQATEYYCGSSDTSDYFSYLHFSFTLTEKGFLEYEKVCEVVAAYAKMLENVGPQKWVFDEIKQMKELEFLYKNQIAGWDMADDLSSELGNYDVERILETDSMMDNFDEATLKEYISYLKPENSLVTLISKKNEGKTDTVDPIYGSCYSVSDMTDSHKASFSNPTLEWATSGMTIKDIHLPEKNEFIPKNFDIVHKGEKLSSQSPQKIRDDEKLTLWHVLDGQFLLPKVAIKILLQPTTMNLHTSARTSLMADLWVQELVDFLRDFSYMAEEADLAIKITMRNRTHLEVGFKGYNDSLDAVHKRFFVELEKFREVRNENKFDTLLNTLVKNTKNLNTGTPLSQAQSLMRECLIDNTFGIETLIREVSKISFAEYSEFKNSWLAEAKCDMLIEGNISSQHALEKADATIIGLEKIFGTKWISLEKISEKRHVALAEKQNFVIEKVLSNPVEKNSAYIAQWEIGHGAQHRNMCILMEQMMDVAYFADLRTEQQLGYSVFSQARDSRSIWYTSFYVVSAVQDPNYCNEKSHVFLKNFREKLAKMTAEEFEVIKGGAIASMKEPFKNIYSQVDSHLLQIERMTHDFDRNKRDISLMEGYSLEKFVEGYDKVFEAGKKIEVHVLSHGMRDASVAKRDERVKSGEVTYVSNPKWFKRRLAMYPDGWSGGF